MRQQMRAIKEELGDNDDTNDDDLDIMDINDNDSKAGKASADLQTLNESLQDLLDGIQVSKHIGFFCR